MTNNEQTKIFAQNLTHYVRASGKMQKDIAKELGYPLQTFNGWCKGVSFPSMDKVQKIADYFHIGKTDLLDKQPDINKASLEYLLKTITKGYSTPKDRPIVDYLVDLTSNENIQILIETARKSDPRDIQMAIDFLKRLQKDE